MNRVVNGLKAPVLRALRASAAARGSWSALTARPNFAVAWLPDAPNSGRGTDWGAQWRRLCEPVRRVRNGRLHGQAVLVPSPASRIFPHHFSPRQRYGTIRKSLKINDRTFWLFNAAVRFIATAFAF